MKEPLPEKVLDEIVSRLQGSCDSFDGVVDSVLEEHGIEGDSMSLRQDDYYRVDNVIFLCNCCGWWCEAGEAHDQDGEDVCGDCYEGEED